MAPFQLRVRTLYPCTQPVPSTPLSIRLGPSPPSDVHPGEVRTQHVGSTRRPLSPELRTTPPHHRTPGTQLAGFTHLPSEVHLHSLGSVFILVLGHSLMSRRTHRSPPCRNVDVKVSSRQPDRPITPVGLRWRPAPDRAHQLRPPTLCLPSVVSGTIRRVAPQLRRTDSSLPQRVYHPHCHTGVAAARWRDLHVGDHLHGVPLFARLRHLHLVPLPLVSAVGHLRVVRRLHRARPHLLRLLQRDRRLTPNPPIDGARTAEGGKGVTSAMMGA